MIVPPPDWPTVQTLALFAFGNPRIPSDCSAWGSDERFSEIVGRDDGARRVGEGERDSGR